MYYVLKQQNGYCSLLQDNDWGWVIDQKPKSRDSNI